MRTSSRPAALHSPSHRRVPDPLALASLTRGRSLEKAGDLEAALAAYEAAHRAAPDDPEALAALAALAHRMEMPQVAAQLWGEVARLRPGDLAAADGQARALRDLGQYGEAVALLRAAIMANPADGRLWNSLGVTLTQDSQAELAITFLDEAVRLDSRSATALYNRGNARFDLNALAAAGEDFAAAARFARTGAERAQIAFARATLDLAAGDLAKGWEGYEARLSEDWPGSLAFEVAGRRWTPDTPLTGRKLLVLGEQGLGDEIMFANVLPDVIEALGPDGELALAVEPRLVDLFQRSFPQARVAAYATERTAKGPSRRAPGLEGAALWAPLGALPRRFRASVADFPQGGGYLALDPAKVATWKAWLGDGPPAVGVSWRSGRSLADRRRFYPPLELWTPLLTTPGVRFVNLQYGDCAEELAALRAAGVAIAEPPDIDLKQDIDELAALCCALDLTVCIGNATAALAGACGAALALVGAPASWVRLGTEGYPWYPQAVAVTPASFGDWGPAMARATGLVAALA